MNVGITKEEFIDILEMLHIASWVLVAHKTEDDPRTRKYGRIMQKFLALAKEAGAGELVEYDPEAGKYHPSSTFEESSRSRDFIHEFEDDTFWDELLDRLTERDLERQVGGYENLRTLSPEDRALFETPIRERYAQELTENGLERFEIVERFGSNIPRPAATHD